MFRFRKHRGDATSTPVRAAMVLGGVAAGLAGCSGAEQLEMTSANGDDAGASGIPDSGSGMPNDDGSADSDGSGATMPGFRLDLAAGGSSTAAVSEGLPDDQCTADLAGTELQPVYLAFAFDVSGSMGKLDDPWHDPTLKWEPVVAATKAFFADPSSVGFEASLTFFPAEDDRCDEASYDPPVVPMMALPSPLFGEAIDEVTPETSDDWRGGTPTLAVTEATLSQLQESVALRPGAQHVFVLVSDGYPQGCDDEADDIENTVDAVTAARGDILTFVIGVQNPPGGPDAVTNLQAIAEAGGTGQAFIVETGSAEATATSFKAAVEAIRATVASCWLEIPTPPTGATFDPAKVNVNIDGSALGYDPTCEIAGSWRYDDPDAPAVVELCPDTCEQVQRSPTQNLEIAFGCDTQPAIP